MNLYGLNPGMYDFDYSEPPIFESISRPSRFFDLTTTYPYDEEDDRLPVVDTDKQRSHRHDGTSPLPFGMDWSHPPKKWDGRDSVWPHDPHTGWSYCVTIPSWIIMPEARGSDPVVFYRVQIGIQSPLGVTTTRGILRRFSDFLKLFSELKSAFLKKSLPPAPPKRLLKTKSRTVMAERRCALEDWMEKLLSDIDVSRSAPVAIFLELEAAARSSFYDSTELTLDSSSLTGDVLPSKQFQSNSDISWVPVSSSVASDYGNDSSNETSEIGTPRHRKDDNSGMGVEKENFEHCTLKHLKNNGNHNSSKAVSNGEDEIESLTGPKHQKLGGDRQRLAVESVGSDVHSIRTEISNYGVENSCEDNSIDLQNDGENPNSLDDHICSDLEFPRNLLVALPSDERNKMNRVLNSLHRRLTTAKTDMEDLIARLNQELAVRQYLTTKVKDLEADLDTTKHSSKENLQQAVLIERERFTQSQWDVEELRRKCTEMGLKLKSEQNEKVQAEAAKSYIMHENEMLQQELDSAREQIENWQKQLEDQELKSKTDVKLLVKEVKFLRSSQSESKQELGSLLKEKLEMESMLQKEKLRWELSNAANAKLLHECEILRARLEECSVDFLVEEEDKLVLDTSSPSDAADLLMTSDNRIGLLLAEAQLLAQDIENTAVASTSNKNDEKMQARDHDLRKMLTDVLVDNARLRKQVNSVLRCALNTTDKSDEGDGEEETQSRKTVLGNFL